MEYESDVPQYSAVWFLPAAATGLTLAVVLIRRFDSHPWAVTRAALVATAVRLAVIPVLAGLGHSTPIVPPVLVVALAADVFRRWRTSLWWLAPVVPLAIHAAYVPLLPSYRTARPSRPTRSSRPCSSRWAARYWSCSPRRGCHATG